MRHTTLPLLLLALHAVAAAVELSAGETAAAPGAAGVSMPVTIASASGEEPCALAFDLVFDRALLAPVGVDRGPSAIAAGKLVWWSSPFPGTVHVFVAGLNQNVIPTGELVTVRFDTAEGTAAVSAAVAVAGVSISDPDGYPLPGTGAGGYVHLRGPQVWVDFASDRATWGTPAFPFHTLDAALPALHPGGTLRIVAGATAEVLYADMPMRLTAEGGPVRIGAMPTLPKIRPAPSPTVATVPGLGPARVREADRRSRRTSSEQFTHRPPPPWAHRASASAAHTDASGASPAPPRVLTVPADWPGQGWLVYLEAEAPIVPASVRARLVGLPWLACTWRAWPADTAGRRLAVFLFPASGTAPGGSACCIVSARDARGLPVTCLAFQPAPALLPAP